MMIASPSLRNISKLSKSHREAIIRHKDECLARHKLKKNRGRLGRKKLETWLKKRGEREQYWRNLFNEVQSRMYT